ncbi:hypothetical protein GGF37_002316 [Kickxella alabastrina]|nr:hypothetical protein GGF37_002316 [Kickxella alabastrina]
MSAYTEPSTNADTDAGFSARSILSEAFASPAPRQAPPPQPQPQPQLKSQPQSQPKLQPQQRTVDVSKHSSHVSKFSISGVSRIRPGFLNDLLQPVFAAQTIKQTVDETREAAGKLHALGIAKAVAVEVDQADNGLHVHFHCEDGSRYIIKTGVDVGDNEGTASITGRLNNIWGGGETLEANYARGNRTQAAMQATLSVPVAADPRKRMDLAATQVTLSGRPYSAHDELRRTWTAAYRENRPEGIHELLYALSWRNICALGANASPTLREDAGHSLKSSVAYNFTRDSRDSPTVPTTGSYVRVGSEAAGIGGDVRFVRSLAEAQTNRDLGRGFVLSSGIQGGLLWGGGARTYVSDRFFLGGSTSVRGFEHRGIGPHDGQDSIGGDAFYALGLSLLTPLPWVKTDALRGHLWANAGQCALLDARGLGNPEKTGEVHRFLTSPSASVGFGLVYRHSMVRVELSCCLPIVATATDRPNPGLHFGLGLQFL